MSLVLILLALVLGGLGAVRMRRKAGLAQPATSAAGPAGSTAVDVELDRAFDAVLAAHGHELADLLHLRLRGLVDRRVPVRRIGPAPGERTARVCFADGTVVLARSAEPGDLVHLVRGMHNGSMYLAGFSPGVHGTRLALTSHGGRSVALVALGLDQPD